MIAGFAEALRQKVGPVPNVCTGSSPTITSVDYLDGSSRRIRESSNQGKRLRSRHLPIKHRLCLKRPRSVLVKLFDVEQETLG